MDGMDLISLLPFAPLRFELVAESEFRAPEFKGALFRGGFGKYLRDAVCTSRLPACTHCAGRFRCSYSVLFETPVLADRFPVMRKYPNAPHPFVMAPPLTGDTCLARGARMDLVLVLIGFGIDYLDVVARTVVALGRQGSFGGSFRVASVTSALDGRPVYDLRLNNRIGMPTMWKPAATERASKIRLDFLTPLRLRVAGVYTDSPTFSVITQALLRRLHLLISLFSGVAPDVSWKDALLHVADRCVIEQVDFRPWQGSRWSGRQQRRVDMDGIIGGMAVSGPLDTLLPVLRAGEWLQLGSGTAMGMGRYQISRVL